MKPVVHEIIRLLDPTLPDVMDIYQQSFPPRVQMPLGWWAQLFQKLGSRDRRDGTLLAFQESKDGPVLGMAYYEIAVTEQKERLGFLWYLATHPAWRCQGVGAACYQELVERILYHEGCVAMVFEIEIAGELALSFPDEPEAVELARRREQWYKRNGARKLTGIHYEQSVGWQPALPMHLLFHSRYELTPETAFSYARRLCGNNVTQLAELGLEP